MSRRLRRYIYILVIGACLGGMFVFILERFIIRPKPVPLPVIVSSAQNTSINTIAPNEFASKILVNPCIDLHSYVCSLVRAEDPTGDVRRDSEGEVEVLRIYENIIRSHKKLSSKQVDELLVQKVYTPERNKKIRDLFTRAKDKLILFIQSQPFQSLSEFEKEILRKRVERVRLELPPPASIYSDEPDLFTRNDVFYERTRDGETRIRVGGALLFTVQSQFNLAFTLSHELAHSIDPCELRSDNIDILSYQGLAQCLGTPVETLAGECTSHGKLAEIFADWAATHVVSSMLQDVSHRFTPIQMKAAIYNSVRDLCLEDDDDLVAADIGLSSSHPAVSYRVNYIFAQHPQIRKLLGCRDAPGPVLPGLPSHCFWPTLIKK